MTWIIAAPILVWLALCGLAGLVMLAWAIRHWRDIR